LAVYSYSIASGHDVALVSLTNIEDITYLRVNGKGVAPRAVSLDRWPQQRLALSGRPHSGGRIDLQWTFDAVPLTGLDSFIDAYLVTSSVDQPSKEVTINTRLAERTTYKRYNARLLYPRYGTDYIIEGNMVTGLRLTFIGLVAL